MGLNSKKKISKPISRVLYPPKRTSIIYLGSQSPVTTIGLPLPTCCQTKRVALICFHRIGMYMAFQPLRDTAALIAHCTGGLLPHLLTLTSPWAGGNFLLSYYTLTNIFPFGSKVPFAARTFLPNVAIEAIERFTYFRSKGKGSFTDSKVIFKDYVFKLLER
jgi:hypothetical protein